MNARIDRIQSTLDKLDAKGLFRVLRRLEGSGGKFSDQGRMILNFSSNDYLNLATDSRLKKAACDAIERYGCGATASRLMSGHLALHAQLEDDLAKLCCQERSLVFSSGFQANAGLLCAIANSETLVLCDKLNHASIIDGVRLSGARLRVYKHGNLDDLRKILKTEKKRQETVIMSDSVFSMDGDLAPVEGLAKIARECEAFLVIDEAHAIGVFGEGGGLCRASGVKPDAIVGTLSKSLGGMGGFVACSEQLRSLLINRARSFIYTTGLAPACAASAIAAMAMLKEEPALGARLLDLTAYFIAALKREGLSAVDSQSQILPIIVGDNAAVLRITARLWERGILAAGVRPPSVPVGTARLRLSVTLAHTQDDLDLAAREIAEAVHAEAR
jgi:8-amino-7-oxononanoate synthase